MEMTLGEAFARSARKFPKKIACMDDEGASTYSQMNERVNRWAHALQGLDRIKGEHVATLSNNCIPLMEVYLGNLKHGIVTVPLDSRGTIDDICFEAESTDCETLVFHSDFSGLVEEMLDRVPRIKTLVCMGGRSPGFAMDYEELLGSGSSKEPVRNLVEEDEAFLMFTGGTTGKPKGAILTHKGLLWNIISVTTENQSNTRGQDLLSHADVSCGRSEPFFSLYVCGRDLYREQDL